MTKGRVAVLSETPKEEELEEYVAAIFQASGHFVETNIEEREDGGVPVLELDVFSTDYSDDPPSLRLIEAKSGRWGFKDIFKVRGWMEYLSPSVKGGALVVLKDREGFEIYNEKAGMLNIDLVHVRDPSDYKDAFKGLVNVDELDDVDVTAWRFYYWAERKLRQHVRRLRSEDPTAERYQAILSHEHQITSDVFFASTVAERVDKLYGTYGRFRNNAASCGYEMLQGEFDPRIDKIPSKVFSDTFYDCAVNELQTACFTEHVARLSLLKSAVDYLCYKEAGRVSIAEKIVTIKGDDNEYSFPIISFPSTFAKALNEIREEPYYKLYPIFWQWFLGVFGGFILLDYENREYELLSEKTGIPVEYIPDAFGAFDKLFPNESGWFREPSNSNIRVLTLSPIPMRGIGANYRRGIYAENGEFEGLDVSGAYTLSDLIQWNNCVVELLT